MKKWFLLAIFLFCAVLLAYCDRDNKLLPIAVPDDVVAVNISYTSPHRLDSRQCTDAQTVQAVTGLLREMTPRVKRVDPTSGSGGGFLDVALCSSDGSERVYSFYATAYQPPGSNEWFFLPYEQYTEMNRLLYSLLYTTESNTP